MQDNLISNNQNIYILLFVLYFLLELKIVNTHEVLKRIQSYKEELLYLNKDYPIKYYLYQNINFQQEKNYDIILQLKDIIKESYDDYIYIYATNIYSNIEEIIKIDESSNNLIDYQLKANINILTANYSEYSLNNINGNTYYQYYYIIFTKGNKNNILKFNFIIFNTMDEIELFPKEFANKFFYRFENNYILTNYIFLINSKFVINKTLNIQFLTYCENSLFNIDIYKKINKYEVFQIYSSQNFNSLDYVMEINNDIQLFYVNLSFVQDNNKSSESNRFAIFFNFLSYEYNNNFQKIPEKSKEFYFLSKKENYFYSIINCSNSTNNIVELNNNLFYILQIVSNENILIKYDHFLLEYFIFNINIDIKINNYYLNDLINNNNQFVRMKSIYNNINNLFFYKANIIKNDNVNKLLIIKLILNDNNIQNKLKIKNIHFRSLPLIFLSNEIYNNNKSFIKYFNSQNFLDKLGYYYISIKDIDKSKILYCPYENTMNLYFGEYDISEFLILPLLENQKLYIINPYNSTLYKGITVITLNNNNNYFFQFGEIDNKILDNLKIDNFNNEINMNKKISIDNNIQECYFFNIYHFNDSFILDLNIIYGNVTLEYLSLDALMDIDKNFYNIFPFNKEILKNYIKIINNPTLIDTSSIELIRIINNQYSNNISNSNNLNKSLFYVNKYKIYPEIEENNLVPLFISSQDTFTKYKININSVNGEIKYKFFLYNGNPLNEDNDEYNISISINNESFYLSIKDNNSIHRGIVNIIRYNQIKITNLCHKNVLIWGQIGKLEENDYEIFYASEKAFTGLMTTGKIYLFVFDYINIIKKKEIGLNPYKFIFDLEKPISNKCNGYYHQSLVSKDLDIKKYIFNPTNINAIYYEIIQYGKVFSFFNEMSLEEFIYIFNNNKHYYLNTLIQQINGYLKVNFYMEYQYDLTDKENELVSFIFDESIYSTNYKLAVINQKKTLLFQVLPCEKIKDFNVLFFKENSNISYSLSNNDNNENILEITEQNIFGIIDLEKIKNEENDINYLGIIKPKKLFIRYLYSNSKIEISQIKYLQEQNKYKYNINIEKIRKVENKDIFSISFDCFLENTITNYFILILNEKEDDIINECQFLSYLYNYKNNDFSLNNNRVLSGDSKYISFKDEGINERISREITFESFGNYKVFILAEELENFSLYKLLGVKTYSYIDEGNDDNEEDKEEKKENEVSFILIILIILLSLLIIILSAFIIYHYVRKENINQIISFMNIPNKDSSNLKQNNMILSFIKNKSENNNNIISNNNLLFPILNDDNLSEKEENNNSKNIQINKNNIEINKILYNQNKIIENDEEKSEPPPPPITEIPPENKISEMLNEIKRNNNNGKIYDKEKSYTNDGSNVTNNIE